MKATSTIKLIILSLNLFVYCMASANVVYVDLSATGSSDGTSWQNADTSLKLAITTSTANDTIKIAKGTYKEGSEIVINKALTLIGGYDNGGSPTPSSSNITQISGENSYRVIKTMNTSGTYIYFFNLEIIEGRHSSKGAGIYNEGAALAFVHCKIINNKIIDNILGSKTSLVGAGIHSSLGSLFMDNSEVNNNLIQRYWNRQWGLRTSSSYSSSYQGAGIYADDTPLSIQNCTIKNNAISVIAPSIAVTSNSVSHTIYGAAISISGEDLNIKNSSLDSNSINMKVFARITFDRFGSAYASSSVHNNSKIIGSIIYSRDADVTIQNTGISSNTIKTQIINDGTRSGGISDINYSNIVEGGLICKFFGDLHLTDCLLNNNSVDLLNDYGTSLSHHHINRTSKIYGGMVLYQGVDDFRALRTTISNNKLSITNLNNVNNSSVPVSNTIVDGNILSLAGQNAHIINTQIVNNSFLTNLNSMDRKYTCEFKGQLSGMAKYSIQNSLISKNSTSLNGKFNSFLGTTINSTNDLTLLSSTIACNSANKLTNQIDHAITTNRKFTCYNSIVSHNKNDGNELNVGSVGSTDIKYSFIRGQNYSGTGNFNGTGNPGFLDSNSNYTLKNTSILIESGNSSFLPVDNFDIDEDNNTSEHIDIDLAGNSRIGNCEIDLGAYESFGSTSGVVYVDSAATGSNNGYSWANAFTDLQDALDLRMTCSKVDTILVAEGTYYPSQLLPGSSDPRAKSFRLQDSNVVLIGGYKASTGSRTGKASILSGDIGTKNNKSDNSYHVLIHTFLDSTTHFQHVTIQDGNATSSTSFAVPNSINILHNYGGGISGRSSTLKLSNIKLINNHANGNGGGIDYLNSDCDASMLLFENNIATNGGAYYIAANGNSTILKNSVFHNNSATNEGGAFYASASTGNVLLLEDSFSNNTSDYGGAIFANGYSNLIITSNYFFKNMANGVGAGGGLFLNGGSTVISKSYFTENTGIGGAIKMQNGNVLNLSNSTFSKTNIYNEGTISVDDSKLKAENCIFDKPRPKSQLTSSLHFKENDGLSTITNCIFNGDPNYTHLQAVLCEDNAKVSILNTSFIHINAYFGVIYNKRGATLTLTNTVFYDKIRDIRNEAATIHSSSSHNASRYTGTSLLSGQTGFVNIKTIALKDLIKDSSNLIGTDNIWGTLDDGLDLKASSLLSSAGSSVGQPILDIAIRTRATPPSIGAHEGPTPCNLSTGIAYVDSAATGSNNGSSWTNAFTGLQDALDFARNCSKVKNIWIAKGTYFPDEGVGYTNNARDSSFHLVDSVALYGGFKGTETLLSQRDWETNSTILSGNIGAAHMGDNTYTVIQAKNLSDRSILNGFSIKGGYNIVNDQFSAGGIYCKNASLQIRNCIIMENNSLISGLSSGNYGNIAGGILNDHSSPIIFNCEFRNNYSTFSSSSLSARTAGGVLNYYSSPSITKCLFFQNTTKAGGTTSYAAGGILNVDNSSPIIDGCAFSGNSASAVSSVAGGIANLIYSSPTISNNIFFNNSTVGPDADFASGGILCNYISDAKIINSTFYRNDVSSYTSPKKFSSGGILFLNSITDTVINCIFWNNLARGGSIHPVDIFSQGGYLTVSHCLLETFTRGTNCIVGVDPKLNISPPYTIDGADGTLFSSDDLLQLQSSSPAIGAGTSNNATTTDITGKTRKNPPSIGAYDGVGSCDFNSTLPTIAGLYKSSLSNINNGQLCFCDANYNLLLALDTTGTGAVIPANGVQLKIGNNPTTSWINSGGIVTNSKGGAIFNRQWEVTPTVQPNNPVKVKYFFTNAEYLSLKDTLANHNNGASGYPTIINSPSEINMYKITSSGTFVDPHSNSAAGIILVNGTTPSLTEWKYSSKGTDHCAEYLVSSFSGGGGGFGGGFSPLPVDLITFTANYIGNHTAQLNWTTASETNNSHFRIERSYDGVEFEKIGRVEGNGNHNSILNYQFLDPKLDGNKTIAYYRLIQVDFNGNENKTNIQIVKFQDASLISPIVYPNPFVNEITVSNLSQEANITLINSLGQTISEWKSNAHSKSINLDHIKSGMYYIQITQNHYTVSYKITKY